MTGTLISIHLINLRIVYDQIPWYLFYWLIDLPCPIRDIPYLLLFSYFHIVYTPQYSKCPVNRSILFVRWRIRFWSRFYSSPDFFQYRLSWPRSIKILFIFFVGIWILSYLAFLYFFRVACYLQVKINLFSQ